MHRLPSAEAVSGKAVPAIASLAFIVVLTALTGCGQKGPLYMPRDGAANPATPAAPTGTDPSTPDAPAADSTDTDSAAAAAGSKQGDQHAA